jgi:AcrR family transcriptional regulator
MTAVSEPDGVDGEALSPIERIRNAALTSFAAHGTSETSLRAVAAAAGVSLGLVQHHFVTKAELIKAVDDHVLGVVIATMSKPIPENADSVAEVGSRITEIFGDRPDIGRYLGRALVEGSPLGTTIFDTLMSFGTARWHQRAERGELRPDLDLTWATINSLVLALGTVSLRLHIDRHLPAPLSTPAQLERWHAAVGSFLREGLFSQPGDR